MILTKQNQIKELQSPKAIARWKRFGWVEEGTIPEIIEPEEIQAPKKRGRPAKKED